MKSVPALLCCMALLLAASCSKKNNNSNTDTTWTYTYTYEEGKTIDSFRVDSNHVNLVVADGHDRVFTFSQSTGQDDQIMDNEYLAHVRFRTDSAATSFSATGGDLQQLTAFYSGGGAWSGYPSTHLMTGEISGQRTDATHWQVHIDVTLPTEEPQTGRQHIVEDAAFTLQP